MTFLALDTSTSAITVAIGDETGVLDRRAVVDARRHTEQLAPLIDNLLRDNGFAPADLTAVVVGNGPGPFTGLRVGMVTAVTMGFALGIPTYGVTSLDALAESVRALPAPPPEILVATDARRKEVYWARYAVPSPGAAPVALTTPAVDRPTDLPDGARALPTIGRGPHLFPELFPHALEIPVDVNAGLLLDVARRRLSEGEDLPVHPLYLRRPDALTSAERAAR